MMDSLKVGDIYDCKEKIFEYFKDVITSEKLNFINKKHMTFHWIKLINY